MVIDRKLEGEFVNLRSVTESDICFTYQIRKDPQFHGLVGQLADSYEKQDEYIRAQIKKKNDYYFVIENKKNEKLGLIGVYNIKQFTAEEGRFVSYGNPVENMEASLLMDIFEREYLGLKRIQVNVYKKNRKIWHLCQKLGYKEIAEDIRGGKESIVMEVSCEANNSRFIKCRKEIDRYKEVFL